MLFNLIIISVTIIFYILIIASKKLSKETNKKIFLALSFFIIAFLMVSRTFDTGNDTPMYVRTFNNFSYTKWNSTIFGGYFEPLYSILNILLSYISGDARILIVVTSIFISYAFYKFIKDNSKNYLMSVLIFIGLLFFYGAMNTIRQYMAISVVLLGFKFVKEKKLIPYIIIVAIAFLFHSSAIAAIILYPMYNMKYSRLRVILIFAIAIVVNIFIAQFINQVYEFIGRENYYEGRIGQENIANFIHMIIYFGMYIFSLFVIRKNKSTNKENNFYLYTFVLTSAFSLIAMKMNVLSRVTTYFNIFSIVCLPNIIEENIKNKDKKIFVITILVLGLITYSSTIIKFKPEWNSAYNYKSAIFMDEGQND